MDPVGLYWPPSIGGLYQYILMEYVPTHFLIMVFVMETISICDDSIVFFSRVSSVHDRHTILESVVIDSVGTCGFNHILFKEKKP